MLADLVEVEFEVTVTGRGRIFVPAGENEKKYIEGCYAQVAGNKLWDTKIQVRSLKFPEKEEE